MVIGSTLTLVVFPNFPILLTAYILLLERDRGNSDNFEAVELSLIYIFSADIISRFVIAHLSDFSFFRRRIGFLVAAFLGGIIIMGKHQGSENFSKFAYEIKILKSFLFYRY